MPQPLSTDQARQRAHMPHGTATILDTRTLATAHRRLVQLLRPGLTVLDVGCGTGAVTRGIAEAVALDGLAVGLDIHAGLLAQAYQAVLQWLVFPLEALRAMRAATKPGGWIVTLEYNHEQIAWEPAPPPSMQHFYLS